MECLDENTVLEFVAGELSSQLVDRVDAHLADCRECMDLVASAVNDRVSSWPGAANVPSSSPPPLGSRVGRFELLELHAEGGMGVVYRARATDTGDIVALKLVKLTDPAIVASLRREIHALSRIEHPGVVRILEQGTWDGLPFYAMDFVEGDTLEARITSMRLAFRGRDPPFSAFVPILTIVRRLCETLAFIHGEGLVHRDLKPGNVIVRQGDVPVLLDFGLSSRLAGIGREAIDAGLPPAGTPLFMAPEQQKSELVDARADLFALGCILYQIFTSQLPPSKSDGTLPPPSSRVRDIPPELDRTVMRLLAKNPRERLGYAQDINQALDRAGVHLEGDGWGPAPRAYVYRSSLVGRERVLDSLRSLVDRWKSGAGGVAFIAGESGIGKTRLALELASYARRNMLRVVVSDCAAVANAAGAEGVAAGPLESFRPVLQVIADFCREGGEVLSDRVIGRRAKVLSSSEPNLSTLPGQTKHPEPTAIPAEAARFRLLAALGETLAAFADVVPALVVLDDIQWADDLSLAFLQALGRKPFAKHPLLIVGTYRSEELALDAKTALKAIADQHHDIGRIGAAEVGRMVGDMLALEAPSKELVQFLSAQAEGHPFFLSEYLRTAVDEKWLTRDADGHWKLARAGDDALLRSEGLPLPSTLQELLECRFAKLSPAARRLADFASVLGKSCDAKLLEAAPDVEDHDLMDLVHELVGRHILEVSGTEHVRFVHDKIRETAYARLAQGELPKFHRAAALAIESAGPAPNHADAVAQAAELAHHWALAGEVEREAPYRRMAGEQAFQFGGYQTAILHLERALELGGEKEDAIATATIERQLAEAYFGVGNMTKSREHLESLARRVRLPMPKTPAGMLLSLPRDLARFFLGRASFVAKRRSHRDREAMTEAARAYERLAHVLFFENQPLAVACSSLRALTAAGVVGSSPELARVYANLSISAALLPLHGLANAFRRSAYAVADEIGDAPAHTWAQQLEGVYRAGIGDWAGARTSFERALFDWEAIGDRRRWEETLTLWGMTLYQAGEMASAADLRVKLEEAGRTSGSFQTLGWAFIGQAEDCLHRGEVEAAIDKLERALSLGASVRRAEQIWLHGLLARAELRAGRQDCALRAADEAFDLLRDTMPTAFYVLEGYSAIAEVYLELGGFEKRAKRAIQFLNGFARVFPIARARALLWEGVAASAHGKVKHARHTWLRAVPVARDLGRRHDELLLWLKLAAHPAPGSPSDEEAKRQVASLSSELGTKHNDNT